VVFKFVLVLAQSFNLQLVVGPFALLLFNTTLKLPAVLWIALLMSGDLGLSVQPALLMVNQPGTSNESAVFSFNPLVAEATAPLLLLKLALVFLSFVTAIAKFLTGVNGVLATLVVVMASKSDRATSMLLLEVTAWHAHLSSKLGIAS